MSHPKPILISTLLILILLAPTTHAKLPAPSPSELLAVAWEHEGRVQLAIANTSSSYEEVTAAFGYQRLGRRIVEEFFVDVPPKTVLVNTYPKITDDSQSSYRVADTIYLFDENDRQVSATQIMGIHPATDHFRVESYLVLAGRDAVVYLETPGPELGIESDIFISVGKTYTLGDYAGKLRIDRVYTGALDKTNKTPFSDMENPDDYHNYLYGWRGLVIKVPTPRLRGVERLDFEMEKFINTPDGTARHGLSAPPILVYGRDMELVEQ